MTAALVTGAGGFVGRHLCRLLTGRSVTVRPVSSKPDAATWPGASLEADEAAMAAALEGVDAVYFLAGVAHEAAVAGDRDLMRRVNVEAPVRWLRAADRAGVRRFVWLSSIKVLGDVSERPLTPDDAYRPGDDYACSKVEAEQRLQSEPLATAELAVVRPPLVYGAGVRGNFRSLLRLADTAMPLPLEGADAPRSMVAVENLCDLLIRLGSGGRGIFHVADAEDVTVSGLLAEMRRHLARPRRLFYVPPTWLRAGSRLTGRSGAYSRLFEPLRVDAGPTCAALDWRPPRSTADALHETVTWYRTSR